MATLPPQVLLFLLCLSMPLVLPRITTPRLLFHPTLGLILDPLVLLLSLLVTLNSNLFFVFSKTLLYMILTYRCPKLWNAQIAFFHDITSPPHTLEDDDECGDNFTANGWIFNTLALSLLFNIFFFSFFQHFSFHFFSLFVFKSLCFLFLRYFPQFFCCVFCIHFSSNTITSRKHTTSYNKWKWLVTVTLFIFVHQLFACFFLGYLLSFN
jgi:hypothetical protein